MKKLENANNPSSKLGNNTEAANKKNKKKNKDNNKKKPAAPFKKYNYNNNNVNNKIHTGEDLSSRAGANKKIQKKKKSDSSVLKEFLICATAVFLSASVLYLVDYEKFVRVKADGAYILNALIGKLPPVIVDTGKKVIEVIGPVAVKIFSGLTSLGTGLFEFLNTNPHFRETWTNVRVIVSFCSSHFVDYLRTIYRTVFFFFT